MWDSLTRPADMAPANEVLSGMPYFLVYSHGDWDHVWGTAGLAGQCLAIAAHSSCLSRFRQEIPATLARKQLEEPGHWDRVRLVPPNITFERLLTLDLGGVTLELHHLPGHTRDSVIGWLPEWGVFLGGDAIETPLPVVNSAGLTRPWLAGLESWAGRPELVQSIPSHGRAPGRESLDLTIEYLRALLGDRNFALPPQLDDFYREAHQKNLIVMDGELELND